MKCCREKEEFIVTQRFLVIQECMQMTGWQTMMRTAILCSRAEYFIDQFPTNRSAPLGEWSVEY
jgi:hypothetical protein